MDNLTHTLFALTLARTPLARAGRGTTAALILASNAPDIDIVATAGGAVKYLSGIAARRTARSASSGSAWSVARRSSGSRADAAAAGDRERRAGRVVSACSSRCRWSACCCTS